MLGEMVKELGMSKFYFSCNFSCTLYFLVKIELVKLKKLTSAGMLES